MKSILSLLGAALVIFLVFFFISSVGEEKESKPKEATARHGEPQPIFIDLLKIMGATKEEVSKIIGRPSKIITTNDCDKLPAPCKEYYYKRDSIVIMYSAGRTVYIQLQFLSNYKFNKAMTSIFGFSGSEVPEILNGDDVYWYHNLGWVKKLSFIESKKKPGYIDYVIATALNY